SCSPTAARWAPSRRQGRPPGGRPALPCGPTAPAEPPSPSPSCRSCGPSAPAGAAPDRPVFGGDAPSRPDRPFVPFVTPLKSPGSADDGDEDPMAIRMRLALDRAREAGFSLVEVVVAIGIFGGVMMLLAGVLAGGMRGVHLSKQRTAATADANQILEAARSL